MSRLVAFVAGGAALAAVPVFATLALLGVTLSTIPCVGPSVGSSSLSAGAPVPAQARAWIAISRAACPDLPEPWIAAIMAQESSFRPDAYAADVNGGTRGLFQINRSVWQAAYGAPWSADRNTNHVWDVHDPEVHARAGGRYLCQRLDTVRRIRAAQPDWPSTRDLTELEALALAHNGGESTLRRYPNLTGVSAAYLHRLRERQAAWSDRPAWTPRDAPPSPPAGCPPSNPPSVAIPAGTPVDVAEAVRTSLAYVGLRSGWYRRCDTLACRAYGYANSGHESATDHWDALVAAGRAHPGDRCPPLGAFAHWATGSVAGHVALVVANDGSCRPEGISLVSNDVGDAAHRTRGGVYLVTLADIENGWMRASNYRGWTDPVCAGARLTEGTHHPAP